MNGAFVEKSQVLCESDEQEEMQETGRDLTVVGASLLWVSHRSRNKGLPVAFAVSNNFHFREMVAQFLPGWENTLKA